MGEWGWNNVKKFAKDHATTIAVIVAVAVVVVAVACMACVIAAASAASSIAPAATSVVLTAEATISATGVLAAGAAVVGVTAYASGDSPKDAALQAAVAFGTGYAESYSYGGGPRPRVQSAKPLNKVDAVIAETTSATSRKLLSKHALSEDEVFESALKWLGDGYQGIGKPDSGVYRSSDGLRQFRMDGGSLAGTHPLAFRTCTLRHMRRAQIDRPSAITSHSTVH